MRAYFYALVCLSLTCEITLPPAYSQAGTKAKSSATATAKTKSAIKKAAYHRVDMLLKGSSCAACLIRIEKKLKAEKGVAKVVVSIYKPYKAALIYDANSSDWKTINRVLTGENVTAANFTDSPVDEVPLVLEPR